MTPDDRGDQFEQRAAQAGADLRSRAAARPIPPFDASRAMSAPAPALADSPVRRLQGRSRVLAAAAAVVVLAVGATWFAGRSDDGDDDRARVTSTLPRPFRAGVVPDGFTLSSAGEISDAETSGEGDTSDEVLPLHLYGPSAEDPRLGLSVIDTWTDDEDLGPDTVITIGDRRGRLLEDMGFGKRTVIVTLPNGAGGVALMSQSMTRQELIALAEQVTREGDRPVVPADALPSDWREVGLEPDGILMANQLMVLRGSATTSNYVAYVGSAPEQGAVVVASMPGDVGRLHAVQVAVNQFDDVTVRGHQAIFGEAAAIPDSGLGEGFVVTWEERPGEIIRVSGYGLDRDAALALAEGIEPVGSAEWKQLVTDSRLGELPETDNPNQGDSVARGEFADGTAWILRVQPAEGEADPAMAPQLTLDVALPSSSSSSSAGSSSQSGASEEVAFPSTSVVEMGGRRFTATVIRGDVASVVGRGADGQVLVTATVGDAESFRWAVLEAVDGVVEVVALDAAGAELGQFDVAPVGDIDGESSPTTVVSGGN